MSRRWELSTSKHCEEELDCSTRKGWSALKMLIQETILGEFCPRRVTSFQYNSLRELVVFIQYDGRDWDERLLKLQHLLLQQLQCVDPSTTHVAKYWLYDASHVPTW